MEDADPVHQPYLLLDGLHRLWGDLIMGPRQQCCFGVSGWGTAILCTMLHAVLSPVASYVCIGGLCAGDLAASCQLSLPHGT